MQAPTKIAVAGATGRVGSHVVDVLEGEFHEFVVFRDELRDLLRWLGLDHKSPPTTGG
jgi:nucleoside-diphosphate-sugar epimerase